ncbi:MAG: glutaredoxin family protein [Gammaproteobacteria bacterium BRH_c0]|nr:MAG: glutaredoxin family protein [Gammaproteobacteria bacterium BRH_c0]
MSTGRTVTLAIFLLAATSLSQAQVYKWTDAEGKVHFSDKKPESVVAEELTLEVNTYTQVTFEKSIYDVGPEVVMYATDWCGYCKKARRYFKKNNIAYKEYDIEKNSKARRKYKAMGATGVPVILVGNKRMNGFSEQRFESLFK